MSNDERRPAAYDSLVRRLSREVEQDAPKSASLHEQATRWLIDGGSHTLRLAEPFPPRIVRANGAWIEDEDGHRILDFWQGHHANVLGHNPSVLTEALASAFGDRRGLLTGFADRLQIEVAELLCRRTGAERVRFTTSGSLATMYATLLALAFTGRRIVMKVGGGWHGSQPWGLKGVGFDAAASGGFESVASHGLPASMSDTVLITRFNDPQMLEDHFEAFGDRIACFIVEPFIGAGGFFFADTEYLRAARRLTERHGALLVLDEVISGFRFRAGDVGSMYGLTPDVATFGKAIGGGMPLAAVGGRRDVMELAGRGHPDRVAFSGGTYSAHPGALLAAKAQMEHLVAHEREIYPRLERLGERMRQVMEHAFKAEGIPARCSGRGNEAVPGSSISMLLFPYHDAFELRTPEDAHDPRVTDIELRERVLRLALLLENVHVVHGGGSVSAAHTEEDIAVLEAACQRVARRIKDAGLPIAS